MKKFDCRKNCRKIKQMRNSSKCLKIGFITNNKIVYSCDSNVKTKEEENYFSCEFINNDIKTQCKSCDLPCIVKNKTSRSRISNKNNFEFPEEDLSKETVIAEYAKKILSDSINGKPINVEKFKLIYNIISKKEKR